MPKGNIFQTRRILFAKLNDIKAEIPIIVAATAEELSQSENHFNLTPTEKKLSRLQLFIKKGKMFAYNDGKPTTKTTLLANKEVSIGGRKQEISPLSIMQNETPFSALKEKTSEYLESVLKIPNGDNCSETYLDQLVNQLYLIIKNAAPRRGEVIHLATMEKIYLFQM